MKKHFTIVWSWVKKKSDSNREKLFDDDDEKVRNHCHITGKFRGAAHWSYIIPGSCNISQFKSHLFFVSLIILKIDVIPNGLEKYMVFILNKNLVFIDSVQFMNSSLKN